MGGIFTVQGRSLVLSYVQNLGLQLVATFFADC